MKAFPRSPVWLGVALAFVVVEVIWRLASRRGYDWRGALTTFGVMAGSIPATLIHGLTIGAVFATAWVVAPVHLSLHSIWTWVGGFLLVEFAYYWFHRASHRMRWLWASHRVHHSAQQITFLSSLRLGWTNLLSAGWLVYVPVILIGFDPRLVALLLAFDLHYQFFLHTEARVSLGPLEWFLNSPSHHRVHHGSNDWCLDRNYGGVLIVFDRLFGTFAAERPEAHLRYGLKGQAPTNNVFGLAFGEWVHLLGDMRKSGSVRRAIATALSPP
jgi:sterol desaturase/sphingolipid hydroxylase (fatty acid hydroxylase superfamily)